MHLAVRARRRPDHAAGLLVPEHATIPHGLIEFRIPAGRYARTTHSGAHEQLPDIWPRFIGEWFLHSGQRIADGPMYDVYRNLRRTTPLAALRTDLHLPIGAMAPYGDALDSSR